MRMVLNLSLLVLLLLLVELICILLVLLFMLQSEYSFIHFIYFSLDRIDCCRSNTNLNDINLYSSLFISYCYVQYLIYY